MIPIILVFVGIAVSLVGLVGLISPTAIRLETRWQAATMATGFWPIACVAMMFDPEFEAASNGVDGVTGGLILIGLWAFVIAMVWLTRRAIRDFWTKPKAEPRERQIARVNPTMAAPKTVTPPQPPSPAASPEPSVAAPSKHIAASSLKRPRKRSGKWAEFVYVDADGVVTHRKITNWRIVGSYISGFCLLRRASRDFKFERIDEWIGYE